MTSVVPDPAPPTHRDAPAEENRLAHNSALLTVAAGAVAVVSYACGLLMAHVLDDRDYGVFAAGQMVLGVVGTVSLALIPLPLADAIRSSSRGSEERRRGMAFALLVSVVLGLVAAFLAGAVAALFASPDVVVITGASALLLFVIAPVWGWLQGELRFSGYAGSSIVEVAVRLGFSVAAALLGWGVGGALAGFAVGAVAVIVSRWGALRPDLAWRPSVIRDRARWAATGDIAVTQLVVSALVAADVVLVAHWGTGSVDAAGYAALATLAKGPIYVAAGTVLVTFPMLRGDITRTEPVLREAFRSFARLALLAAVVLGTVPTALIGIVLPERYLVAARLLPWMAVAGLGYACLVVLATVLLALRSYRRTQLGLAVATTVVSAGLAGGWWLGGVDGLAVGSAVGATCAAVALAVIARPFLPTGTARSLVTAALAATAAVLLLVAARSITVMWIVVAGGLVLGVLRGARAKREQEAVAESDPSVPGPMRLLHLGFEDPAMPGAGGGSRRTHEINRRIAAEHTVTVLVQRYPGCRDRIDDGVRYVHVGFGAGRTRFTRLLGYVVGLPMAVRRHPSDLVIEDFFAPFSSMAAPLWTGRPTIGVVQWLNAEEKSRQYRLPLSGIERFGVRSHRHLIAVSSGVADRLLDANPALRVDVIGNGVDRPHPAPVASSGRGVLFVGRLETAQKGVDLLLEAWALAASAVSGDLTIAGDGPDRERLEKRARALGIDDSVRFVGWVDGATRLDLMSRARVVAIPSRFETFGMVALEALVTGTPVVAFDIPCLRDVVPPTCGRLVPAFDVPEFATTLADVHADVLWVAEVAHPAREFAARYDWDTLAARQVSVYAGALRTPVVPAPREHHDGPLVDPVGGG